MEAECLAGLQGFVRNREGAKPESVRCNMLYDAAAAGACTKDGLLLALGKYRSVPPTGKGCPTVEDDRCPAGSASDSDDNVPLADLRPHPPRQPYNKLSGLRVSVGF